MVSGGLQNLNDALANNLRVTQRNQILVFSWMSGKLFMILSLVNVVFSIVRVQLRWLQRMVEGIQKTYDFGTNPCSEIILRNREFCNLSEVVVRASDTRESLLEKVRLATILGTFQATLVNFKYVSSAWRKNCEEERLLGVSLTGIMDSQLLNGKDHAGIDLLSCKI